ncbi:MAG: HEAT repeat domain-containing protein [Planctomycetes bacterium]|nr:HEAT repeat domain-containing protein [Planctomycetota bacterium]
MKRLVPLILLLAAACVAPGRMRREVVEQNRREILALAGEGKTDQAWEKYFELVNRSAVDQYPDLLFEIATETLRQGMRAPHPEVRLQAVRSLRYADGDFAFDAAIVRLEDADLSVRAAAADLLLELARPEAAKLIRSQLKPLPAAEQELFMTDRLRAHEKLRMHALLALAALGEKSLPTAPAVDAMSSSDPRTRALAARALGEMGSRDALPSLRYGLEEGIEWQVNAASAEALLKLGERGLIDGFALEAAQCEYPEKIVWAIDQRQYHDLGPTVDWILKEGTYNRSEEVRARAAVALGEMNANQAVPRLKEMLRHFEAIVRVSAAYALVRLNNRAKIRVIVDATHFPDPEVRARSVEYLVALGNRRYVRLFRSLQEDPDARVRLAATLAFRPDGIIPPDETFKYLAWPLGDDDATVKFAAAALIRSIWQPKARE